MVSFFRFSFCLFGGTVGLFGFLRQDLNINPGRPPTHRTSPLPLSPQNWKKAYTPHSALNYYFYAICIMCLHEFICTVCVCRETKDGIRSPETRIMGGCKPLNPGLLQS